MSPTPGPDGVIGRLPYRLQLAGGWIDQPFVSARNPEPPGSMVVVSLQPSVRFMDRSGMATGTRARAFALWGDQVPSSPEPMALVRELYAAENAGQAEPTTTRPSTAAGFRATSSPAAMRVWRGGWRLGFT